jgi:peptide-methionine (S)-S-oxide reductase
MTQKATFGAGCFWGVEDVFSQITGVISTAAGYSGGNHKNPTYKDVCTGTTGHAEVVHLEYDPSTVSYETLLRAFWDNHNPTTLNRQGPDIGTQYRSVVFFHTPEQQISADSFKVQLEKKDQSKRPIVTEITEATTFYRAEDYHQKYLEKRGLSHCSI